MTTYLSKLVQLRSGWRDHWTSSKLPGFSTHQAAASEQLVVPAYESFPPFISHSTSTKRRKLVRKVSAEQREQISMTEKEKEYQRLFAVVYEKEVKRAQDEHNEEYGVTPAPEVLGLFGPEFRVTQRVTLAIDPQDAAQQILRPRWPNAVYKIVHIAGRNFDGEWMYKVRGEFPANRKYPRLLQVTESEMSLHGPDLKVLRKNVEATVRRLMQEAEYIRGRRAEEEEGYVFREETWKGRSWVTGC